MTINKLQLFNISQGMGYVYFWISLAIPYLMYRGLSTLEALSLMSLYQLVGVFLEYPTGVIGDRFGYRRSIFLANTLNALSMVIMAQAGPKYIYIIAIIILAIGSGLGSGNDKGLLMRVSDNPRRDTANLSAIAEFIIFLSAIVGAWIGAISFELALYISALFMFCANIPLYFLPSDRLHKTSYLPLTQIVRDGLRSFKNPLFAQLFFILAIYGGFFFSTKSIIGSFVDLYGFDLKLVGLIIGVSALCRAMGSKLYSKYQQFSKFNVLLFITLLIFTLSFTNVALTVVAILIFHFCAGYLLSAFDGDIHDMADDHIRSSLFSLKRLIMRLSSSLFIFIYGIFIARGLFGLLMFGLAILMFITFALTTKYTKYQVLSTR